VGITFKVVEIDRSTKEDLGTYVAKVGHSAESGRRALKAYSLARSHLGRHPGLSAIFEVAREWRENEFVALMTWIEGAPLREFIGVFPLLAEEQQEVSSEALALRWLQLMCEALNVLHRNGLIHGDISPRNIIVSGSDLVLTDYDFVSKIGEPAAAPGTVLYCSPSFQNKRAASPSDDIYALAASFFYLVFVNEPFQYGGIPAKECGLNW
jgi:serine/threonine protein kinase